MKKVDFKKISIVNFLSIGDEPVTVEFNKGLHVITGKNRDKPDRRNAIGKSTIADSVYFAIFGETLREIKKDLIPNNLTNGKTHVELDFEVTTNSITHKYKIIRNLSPSKAFIFKDGVDKTRDSISNTTKYIARVLSASPAIFQNCIIMTVNNAVPFMAKNKIEKRKFIEDIFGMEVFSTMLSTLRNEYNELKREHDTELTKLEEVSKSLKNYSNQKEKLLEKRKNKKELYDERQSNNTQELEKLLEEITNYGEVNIKHIQSNISSLNDRLDSCELKINTDIENISTKKTKVKYKKDQYLKIGTSEEKCPVCLRNIEDHDTDLISEEKAKLKEKIEEMVGTIKIIGINLDELRERKGKILAAINSCHNKLAEAKVTLQKRKSAKERADQLQEWLKELKDDLKSVETTDTDFDNLIKDTKKRIYYLEKRCKKI